MEILRVNVVGYYYFNPRIELKNYNNNDNEIQKKNKDVKCNICLKSIYEPSYETISNNNNILYETKIELGKCGHLFHSDCIKSWLKTNQICPIDKVMWCKHRTIDYNPKYCFNKKYFNKKNKQAEIFLKNEINKNLNPKMIKDEMLKDDIFEEFEGEEFINEVLSDLED